MKKILSTVLALCMILGCVAVGFTAQAAKIGDQLQAAINDAIANGTDVNWTGGDVELTQALTINGDVKINFNGATILGAPHKQTITISRGNVELIDADIEGTGAKYHYIPAFIDEVKDACPTIYAVNANVTLTDMVVTGAYIRIVGTDPNTGEAIPMSDAITLGSANTTLNLNNVRAFGNNGVENLRGSKVNVVDCLVGGYINDFYDGSNVTFANGTTQYSGYELFKEALADQVTLTPGEEQLISKVLGRWMEVTASVKKPTLVEPTYAYDADTDTLTVTATADKCFEEQVENAFDYYYIPKTATILGETKDFVKTGDLTYTATFTGIEGDTVCDTDLVYKLAVDLYEDAQAAIDGLIAQVEDLVNSLPALVEKFYGEIYDFIDTYINGEQGYATLLWNAYNEYGVEDLLTDLNNQIAELNAQIEQLPEGSDERAQAEAARDEAVAAKAKAEADIKAFFGPIFDLCGASLKGNSRLNESLAAIVAGTATQRQINDATAQIATMNNKYGSHLDVNNGAIGLLDQFTNYLDEAKALAVQNGEFNDIRGLGEYIGENYLDVYDLAKEFGELAHRVGALLNDPDNYVFQMLEEKNITLGGKQISDYVDVVNSALTYVDKAFAYADRLFSTATYQNMKTKYGDKVPALCGLYLEKAYTIATNLDTYFPIETDGTLVEGFEFPQTATYTTPADVDMVKVTVNVSGYGKYEANDAIYTTTQVFNVPMGGNFNVTPVEMGDEVHFDYFALSDTDGNARLSPNGGNLTVYSDTILTVYFSAATSEGEDPTIDVVFMTNYEMSSLWLNTLVAGEIDELPAAPFFSNATFLGWATQNVSGIIAEQAGILMDADAVIDAANEAEANTTFYAIYKFDKITVDSALLDNTLSQYGAPVVLQDTHEAYFTVIISDRALAAGDTIVEAGILAAGNAATIEAATPNGGSGIIKGNLDLNAYTLPAYYTYAVHFNNHSTDRTAYAKGFVTIKHADGTYTTEYSEPIMSAVIPAYD